jgi:hypothetical protein
MKNNIFTDKSNFKLTKPVTRPLFYENGIVYSGAGTIVIEDFFDSNNEIEPCIVLVKNKEGVFMDFGGSYETEHKSLNITAHIELREESRNLLHINPKYFNHFIDMRVGKFAYYRVHILKINGISQSDFNFNKHLIDGVHALKQNVPYVWRETYEITHIPIKNINFDMLGQECDRLIVLKDIDGRDIILHNRTKKALFFAHEKISTLIMSEPTATYFNRITYRSESWTNGTRCFLVK